MLTVPTLREILRELSEAQRAEIDPGLDTSPLSPNGQLAALFANELRIAWEAIGAAYDIDPDTQEGERLDWVCALTGTFRRGATRSSFFGSRKITVTLDAGITLPVGSVAHVDGRPDIRVETTEDVTNTGITTDDFEVSAQAEDTGPIAINASTLTTIATPVVGWQSVSNPFDASIGQDVESDPDLRLRRKLELRKPGASTPDSIAAALQAIRIDGGNPIVQAIVYENDDLLVDSRGLPGKTIEAVIVDPSDAAPDNVVAQTIWTRRAAGMKTFGASFGTALTSTGEPREIRFSRAELTPFEVRVSAVRVGVGYPGDVEASRIVAQYMRERAVPEQLVRWSDAVAAMKLVPGIVAVSTVRLFDATYPTFTDYQMPPRSFPLFDSSLVFVTVST